MMHLGMTIFAMNYTIVNLEMKKKKHFEITQH